MLLTLWRTEKLTRSKEADNKKIYTEMMEKSYIVSRIAKKLHQSVKFETENSLQCRVYLPHFGEREM